MVGLEQTATAAADKNKTDLEMATCPRCLGALTENHRCPRGPLSRVRDAIPTVLLGSLLGIVVCFAIEERPSSALLVAASALGAVLANAIRQAAGPKV